MFILGDKNYNKLSDEDKQKMANLVGEFTLEEMQEMAKENILNNFLAMFILGKEDYNKLSIEEKEYMVNSVGEFTLEEIQKMAKEYEKIRQ